MADLRDDPKVDAKADSKDEQRAVSKAVRSDASAWSSVVRWESKACLWVGE